MSPIVDQTIRCINGENTLLKRVFRVPNPRRAVTAGLFETFEDRKRKHLTLD